MRTDYVRRLDDVVVPCRPPNSDDDTVRFETNLSTETITWSDSAGHDLHGEGQGHLKVKADKSLVLSGVEETDAGVYVCTVSKLTSSGATTVSNHIVNLHGNLRKVIFGKSASLLHNYATKSLLVTPKSGP